MWISWIKMNISEYHWILMNSTEHVQWTFVMIYPSWAPCIQICGTDTWGMCRSNVSIYGTYLTRFVREPRPEVVNVAGSRRVSRMYCQINQISPVIAMHLFAFVLGDVVASTAVNVNGGSSFCNQLTRIAHDRLQPGVALDTCTRRPASPIRTTQTLVCNS